MTTKTSKPETVPLFHVDGGSVCPECQSKMEDGKCSKDGCKGKSPKTDSVLRIDWGGCDPWSQTEDWGMRNVQPMIKREDGTMIGRACITNVGVFTYHNSDGTVTRELRPEEEVFHPDALASMALLPITNNHPPERVTPENVQQYQVGATGDGIRTDSLRVFAPIVVSKQDGLDAIEAGRTGLSVGYSTTVVDTPQTYTRGDGTQKTYNCPGVWMGVQYDHIQTNLRGNHLALVDIPRAGDDAYLKMDGVGVEIRTSTNTPNPIRSENMMKIKLDGQSAEFEVAEPVKAHIDGLTTAKTTLEASLASKTTENSTLSAKVDSLTSDLDKARKDSAEALKVEQGKLDGAVASRLALIAQATKYGVTLKGDENDTGIQRAIILGAYPDATPKLDAADAAYLLGRFDAAVESLEAAHKDDGAQAAGSQRADAGESKPGSLPGAVVHQTLQQKADAYTASLQDQVNRPVGLVKPAA